MHTSTIQVLKLNEVQRGVSRKTGQPWERHTAECLVLADDGSVECVGRLNIPDALRAGGVAPGTYRAGFSLHVPTYGDDAGAITTRLVSLQPVPVRTGPAPSQPSKAAV